MSISSIAFLCFLYNLKDLIKELTCYENLYTQIKYVLQ